jgi:uncharacterized membrane protein YcaP (DUF421 family)
MHIVFRVILIYLCILIGMRILGKREFGQLGPMEFVLLLLIPDLVSQGVIGNDYSMTTALIAVATLFALVFVTSVLVHLSKRAEKIIEGQHVVLVHDGKLLQEMMNRERVTAEEIFTEMYHSGLDDLKQVKWAILSDDGKIAVIPVNK